MVNSIVVGGGLGSDKRCLGLATLWLLTVLGDELLHAHLIEGLVSVSMLTMQSLVLLRATP